MSTSATQGGHNNHPTRALGYWFKSGDWQI